MHTPIKPNKTISHSDKEAINLHEAAVSSNIKNHNSKDGIYIEVTKRKIKIIREHKEDTKYTKPLCPD